MPTNKKEGLIFGVVMCFGMVCVMSIYNAIINGAIQDFSLVTVFEMVIGFMVALLLDLLLVGPLAKKIAFSLPFDKSKKLYVILAMSTCMVIGMVLCMSVFGLVTAALSNGINGGSIFSAYLMIVLKNFILAYPLQLLIMGPLVRGIFMKFVKPKLTAAV
ncbi:putative integral membrane protein [Bacillus subtilis]